MKLAHFRIEFEPRALARFLAALAPLAITWFLLPEETRHSVQRAILNRTGRILLVGPMLWTAGWFMLLFVKGEDLDLLVPSNLPALIKLVGGTIAAVGFVLGVASFASLN